MKRFYKLLFVLLFSVFFIEYSFAQQAKADSLYREYSKTTVDTVKVELLIKLFNVYSDISPAKGAGFGREAVELSQRINYAQGLCNANSLLGDYYSEQLNYSEAMKHYLKASIVGENKKMYPELSGIYNRIGIIYSNQKKHELCLKYFLKVAKLAKLLDKPKRYAIACNNMGIACKDLGRYPEAKNYYMLALKEFEKSDFKVGIASVNNGLGTISDLLGDYDGALEYYRKSMAVFFEAKDSSMASGLYTNIGEVYNHKKEYEKALSYYLKGLKVVERSKNNNFRLDAYEGLSKVYANMKNFEKAYQFQNKFLALSDTINDEDGMQQVHDMEKRIENEKSEKEIEILKQRQEIQTLKVKSQSERLNKSRIIIYAVAGVLLIVLIMSFFIFKSYKQIKRTNIELAEKKKEIQDSINYAKKIQDSMLPEVSILMNYFPKGGFGFFQPKDVVSGDFYWFSELNGVVYFAAADCTGHGVPGAFMSMIGIDKLNSFIDKKVEQLPQILSLLNISIKKALKQSKHSVSSKDGMDIAICSFDRTTKILNYAGANRPLWILRKNEIVEYKPTKAAIAGHVEDHQEYIGHKIQLEEDDVIYLFSDGFADQFGGPNKKKFMSKTFKNLLIDIQPLSMREQEIKMKQVFNDWKGNLEQVDDVLVLGFKV